MDEDQEPRRHCHAAQFTKPCSRWQRYTVVRPKAFTTASISRTSLDSPRDQPRFDTMRFIKTRTISYAQNAVLERLKNAQDAAPSLWGKKKKKRFNSISACAFTATTRERKKKVVITSFQAIIIVCRFRRVVCFARTLYFKLSVARLPSEVEWSHNVDALNFCKSVSDDVFGKLLPVKWLL